MERTALDGGQFFSGDRPKPFQVIGTNAPREPTMEGYPDLDR